MDDIKRIRQLAGMLTENVAAVPGIGKLDEVSPATLDSYRNKRIAQHTDHSKPHPAGEKAHTGMQQAYKKSAFQNSKTATKDSNVEHSDDYGVWKSAQNEGAESTMQMAGNVGRGQADAAFDAAQPNVDEGADDAELQQLKLKARKDSMNGYVQHVNMGTFGPYISDWYDDDETVASYENGRPIGKSEGELEEKAPPGMEDMVMKLKKEYPDDHSKAFATAWSIYNKKHGKTEESTMNEESYDVNEYVEDTTHLVTLLKSSFVEPEKIVEIVTKDLQEKGCTDEEIANIMDTVSSSMEGQPDDMQQGGEMAEPMPAAAPEMQDDDSGPLEEVGMEEGLPQPMPPRTAEELRQRVEQNKWKQHQEDDQRQQQQSPAEMAEAYDMNNGYGDTHSVHPDNYFPDGADSPVVCKTGASGARQGDNPEQKKMAVAEMHKELVYNYRNFLKESIKTLPRVLRKK